MNLYHSPTHTCHQTWKSPCGDPLRILLPVEGDGEARVAARGVGVRRGVGVEVLEARVPVVGTCASTGESGTITKTNLNSIMYTPVR